MHERSLVCVRKGQSGGETPCWPQMASLPSANIKTILLANVITKQGTKNPHDEYKDQEKENSCPNVGEIDRLPFTKASLV